MEGVDRVIKSLERQIKLCESQKENNTRSIKSNEDAIVELKGFILDYDITIEQCKVAIAILKKSELV